MGKRKTFDLFKKDHYVYRFRNMCEQIDGLELDDGTEKVFINTKGHVGDVDEEFEQVMKIFNGLAVEETEEKVQQIVDVAMKYEPDYDVEAICTELMSAR